EFLISLGAKIDQADNDGWAPLHLAAQQGHFPAVQSLLNAGADKTVKSENGQTALDLAVSQNHKEIIALLSR
ncbi:MAG TPA: ankyrin repeat domain-containing protein, partial [Candidatus Rifleibacterium sp.]|nr:ankyrin repeat domain-containing protein [Candidatus Rifleibacterium sp.]